MPRSCGLIHKVIFRETDQLVILLEWMVAIMVFCPNIQTKAQSEIDAPWSSKALLNITFQGTLQGNAYSGQDSFWSKFFWGIYLSTLHILWNHIAALCLAFLLGSLLPWMRKRQFFLQPRESHCLRWTNSQDLTDSQSFVSLLIPDSPILFEKIWF